MRRGLLVAFALPVTAVASMSVGADPPRAVRWHPDPATEVLLVEDHRVPKIFLRVELAAGTWSGSVRSSGADRAFEILLDDPAGLLREELDRLGAELDLSVGPRAARLAASCLAEDLDGLAALVSRVLQNPELDPQAARRRLREARLGWQFLLKQPAFLARRAQAERLFDPADPRRQEFEPPRGGRAAAQRLRAARDALLRAAPRRIGFAGDLSRADAERIAADLLPPSTDAATFAPPVLLPLNETVAPADSVELTLAGLTQVRFAYGRESLAQTDPDYPAFLVADHVLGGHFYSRLHRELRHRNAETYAAYSVNLGDVVPGLYLLETFTRDQNAVLVEQRLRDVLRRFHAEGISEAERAAAVGFLRGRRAFSRQSPAQRLDERLRELRLGVAEGWADEAVERAQGLSLAEINSFIRTFFDPDRFVLVRVAPRG